jgi:hypothetical protein
MHGCGIAGALWSMIRLTIPLGIVLCGPQPARATIVTATLTGTVDGNGTSFSEVPGGIDTTGVFGTPGASLIGDPFKLVYTIDDTKGQQGTLTDANGAPYYSYIQSRTTFFPQYNQVFNINPITSAVLTLTTATGQHSYTFGTFQGSAPFPNPVGNGYVSRDVQQKLASFSLQDDDNDLSTFRSSEVQTHIYFTNPPITPSYKWNSPLSYTLNPSSVNPSGQAGGDFEILSSTNGKPTAIAGAGLLPTQLVIGAPVSNGLYVTLTPQCPCYINGKLDIHGKPTEDGRHGYGCDRSTPANEHSCCGASAGSHERATGCCSS